MAVAIVTKAAIATGSVTPRAEAIAVPSVVPFIAMLQSNGQYRAGIDKSKEREGIEGKLSEGRPGKLRVGSSISGSNDGSDIEMSMANDGMDGKLRDGRPGRLTDGKSISISKEGSGIAMSSAKEGIDGNDSDGNPGSVRTGKSQLIRYTP
jgi:hypothetical protein